MDKLNLDLEFCYGIKKLQKEIDFSCIGTKKRHSYAIYAPNGVMKTSLAKTFKDFANGKQSKDEVFSEKPNKRVINDENGSELQPEEVFVIEPYNEKFTSNKLTTLVAKQELKDLYDNAHLEIDKSKQEFLKKLKHLSGLSGRDNNIVQAIEDTFNKDFFNCLIDLKDKIINETLSFNFSNIIYNEIFTEKVLKFLNTSNFKEDIKQYIENYNELIDKSDFLKKDFNHYNAEKVNKNLKDNGFFKANHSINLNNGQSKQEILDEIDLERVITEEKEKVLNSDQLKSSFNTIDKKLTNVDLVKFRDYLFDNMIILSELANLDNFKKNLWLSYFVDQKALFIDLVDTYEKKRIVIEQIIKDAKEDKTKWENVIKIFNDRFKTPFSVKIRNQEDVILKDDIPSFDFYFADQGTTVAIDKTSLLNVLSQGEKRALYLLNIIFEVEARKSATQKTLFIVDDIADSFDYKNKYAIIEYLKEIGSDPLFKQIILTHNFDFFRTIESRFVGRKQCLMVIKTDSDIKLDDKLYLKPFSYFKNNLHKDNNILIASIPFIRNIIEYCKDEKDSDYKRLTSLLHLKSDTTNITISDLEVIIKQTLPKLANINLADPQLKVIDLLFTKADELEMDTTISINLEKKIVLSIAVRLKAETFMIDKINNTVFVQNIAKNQTIKLFEEYKRLNPTKQRVLDILGKVNLMTPENIHFNSFMYEPILDISEFHLKELYSEVKSL